MEGQRHAQPISEDIIHEMLEGSRDITLTKQQDQIFEMAKIPSSIHPPSRF